MQILTVEDVVELLRRDIDRVGSQSEWARQTGIQRPELSRVLNGHRLPSSSICEALKLKRVLVRRVSAGNDPTKPAIISRKDVLLILRERIKKAGSITSWSKLVGVDRSHLSKVLHNVRMSMGPRILAILGLSEVLIRGNESRAATGKRGRHDAELGKKRPRGRRPRISRNGRPIGT